MRLASLLAGLLVAPILWQAPTPAPSLADVLARAAAAVERYAQEAAVILADEQADQSGYASGVEQSAGGLSLRGAATVDATSRTGRRRWKAELALVRTEAFAKAGTPWLEVRDVVEVDGRRLADREKRLEKLLLGAGDWSMARARELLAESARFNIGPVSRNVNTPAVSLLVLHAVNQARFTFARDGEEKVDGVSAWRIGYEERSRPTLIKSADGSEASASGTFWIDPATGDVLRSHLRCGGQADWTNEMTVTFRPVTGFNVRLPVTMTERTEASGGVNWVEAKYRYGNFRRFETGARLITPK
jgi:hypothetical protein